MVYISTHTGAGKAIREKEGFMSAGSLAIPVGIHIESLFMRLFCGHIMLSADRASAEPFSDLAAVRTSNKAKSDEEASRAFALYGNSILRLAYSYLHNMEDAEDILQETLLRFMSKAPGFENDSHEKAWLLRVAANLSKNRIDYNNIRRTDELNEELAAEEKTDLSFVWEAVKSLTENQREAVHLFYQENYTTAQIAEILNEKESTVRSHLKRGRDRLKEILKEEYDFDEIQ